MTKVEVMETAGSEELLDFFKALAEPNRLRIVGLLARQPYPVEDIAAILGLGLSTVSHHLSKLSKAGLVSARAKGYYSVYSLETEALSGMAKQILKTDALPALAGDVDLDSFDRKVLSAFLTPDGGFKGFPVQEKKFLVLLRHAANAFEPGVRYPEKQVNKTLSKFNKDTARLRRGLVDHKLMAREGGGGEYWRLPEPGGSSE